MSQVVVDASLAVKLVLEEEDSQAAKLRWAEWIQTEVTLVAPSFFVFECISAISWNVTRHLISLEIADLAFQEFLTLASDVLLLSPPMLHESAWEISKALKQGQVYDSYYVALAKMLDSELWTADEKLYLATQRLYSQVKHIRRARRR